MFAAIVYLVDQILPTEEMNDSMTFECWISRLDRFTWLMIFDRTCLTKCEFILIASVYDV